MFLGKQLPLTFIQNLETFSKCFQFVSKHENQPIEQINHHLKLPLISHLWNICVDGADALWFNPIDSFRFDGLEWEAGFLLRQIVQETLSRILWKNVKSVNSEPFLLLPISIFAWRNSKPCVFLGEMITYTGT